MSTSSENAKEIAIAYLQKAGHNDYEILGVRDKIYKWQVSVVFSKEPFIIEISKSEGTVLKFEQK